MSYPVSRSFLYVFFSSRRRHTRCALVTGVQTCALPICNHDDCRTRPLYGAGTKSRTAPDESRRAQSPYQAALCLSREPKSLRRAGAYPAGTDRFCTNSTAMKPTILPVVRTLVGLFFIASGLAKL